jgi:ubiquinone/menaquinone biosynthesis C-methylase UbiE
MTEEKAPLKIDIGCGKNKCQGFTGMDSIAFEGVDIVHDVRITPWPFEDGQVDEVHSSHFLEHLTGEQRVAFFNELYRVMKPGATARIITPHWSNERAYGDPTHQWPPVCSWTYFYLLKSWREVNAPHTGYNCDFYYSLVGTLDPNDTNIAHRNDETKGYMMRYYVNSCVDLVATVTKNQ